jgi:hypothetical protein
MKDLTRKNNPLPLAKASGDYRHRAVSKIILLAASKVKNGGIYMAKYKKAESQGAYIDRLRTQYPFRIIAHGGYEAVLCGVQPLLEGRQSPIYRFPGGPCVVDVNEIEKIVEW